jgi:hypothetical protein
MGLFWVAFLKISLNCLQAASIKVSKSQETSAGKRFSVPLTEKVTFKTVLQKGNRVQVPRLIRWQFKMETDQVLKVWVNIVDLWTSWQFFYAKMGKDGRILIPKLTLALLKGEKTNLESYVMEVRLEPAQKQDF